MAAISFNCWRAASDLMQAYGDRIDRRDAVGFTALFTPDGVFDFAPGQTFVGRDVIAKAAHALFARGIDTSHQSGTPVLKDGATAGQYLATTYALVVNRPTPTTGYIMYGRYEDELRSVGDRLLFSRRRVVAHLVDGADAPRYWLDRQGAR